MSAASWPQEELRTLTELEAYDAMLVFLEAYWDRGLKESDDIAVLLGSASRGDGRGPPLDRAQWSDWREAVRRVKHKPVGKPE